MTPCACGCGSAVENGAGVVMSGRLYHWEHAGPAAVARLETMTGSFLDLLEATEVVVGYGRRMRMVVEAMARESDTEAALNADFERDEPAVGADWGQQ